MIDFHETTVHQFGQLAIALHKGKFLAVGINGEKGELTVLFQCDTICKKNSSVKCGNKEIHKLCVRK